MRQDIYWPVLDCHWWLTVEGDCKRLRKKHFSVLYEKIRQGDLPWLASQSLKFFTIPIGYFINKPLSGPVFGNLIITYKCNMRCLMCDLWRRHGQKEISLDDIKRITDDFKTLGVSGIGLSGGEPLLRDDIFEIINYIKKVKKIPVAMSSNGYFLNEKDAVSKLFDSGLDSIAISLDSLNPEEHNKFRGIKDAYQKAVSSLETIIAVKNRYPNLNVTLATVINKKNINELSEMVRFGERIGVDGVSFLPGQIIGLEHGIKQREEKLIPEFDGMQGVDRKLDELIQLKTKGAPIDNSVKYLKLLKHYFRGERLPIKCFASHTSYVIDAYGDIFPCFGWTEMKKKMANISDVDLVHFWRSKEYNRLRKSINKCRDCYFSCQIEFALNYAYGNF